MLAELRLPHDGVCVGCRVHKWGTGSSALGEGGGGGALSDPKVLQQLIYNVYLVVKPLYRLFCVHGTCKSQYIGSTTAATDRS